MIEYQNKTIKDLFYKKVDLSSVYFFYLYFRLHGTRIPPYFSI